jgi:hypothetical protein
MNPFEQLPSRVRYYLLDFKDNNLSDVRKKYGKGSLREFSAFELKELWDEATKKDGLKF